MTSNWIRQKTPWFVISLNITSAHKWQNNIELNRRRQLDICRALSSIKVERAAWYMVHWEKCPFSFLLSRLDFMSFGLKIFVGCSNENKRKRNAGTCRKNCIPTIFFSLPLIAGLRGTMKTQFRGKPFFSYCENPFPPLLTGKCLFRGIVKSLVYFFYFSSRKETAPSVNFFSLRTSIFTFHDFSVQK